MIRDFAGGRSAVSEQRTLLTAFCVSQREAGHIL